MQYSTYWRMIMVKVDKLKQVFDKTKGHCHFCGDPIIFEKYGVKDRDDIKGAWEADHIIQKGKGGSKDLSNCLPACVDCNRLRWHYKGNSLRYRIRLGNIAQNEIKKKSAIGKELDLLYKSKIESNFKRRSTKKISKQQVGEQ